MKNLLKHPVMARVIGAAGAAGATFFATHDWRAAAMTAATFLVYGTAHSAATAVGRK